jgi:uncharacterized SAM-dependent methyltransferase
MTNDTMTEYYTPTDAAITIARQAEEIARLKNQIHQMRIGGGVDEDTKNLIAALEEEFAK